MEILKVKIRDKKTGAIKMVKDKEDKQQKIMKKKRRNKYEMS